MFNCNYLTNKMFCEVSLISIGVISLIDKKRKIVAIMK